MVTETDTTSGLNDDTVTTSKTNTQEDAKTYTQDELNSILAKTKRKERSKYEDLGTPEELKALKDAADAAKQAEQIEKGKFEEALQDLAKKKDEQISKRDEELQTYRVNAPIMDAATKHRGKNLDQVNILVAPSIKLSDDGTAEIIGEDGKVRYNDDGTRMTVDQRVSEFLDSNPHFVQPTKSTTNTNTNINNVDTSDFDPNSLDMTNPKHRAKYAKWKKDKNLR